MEDEERIPTNLRTLLIVEILGRSDSAMTPTEINHQLGLPKQTVHRLCATLIREGFLIHEGGGKKLRASRRLRELASGILYSSQVHIARHQVLVDIARTVNETVNFVVPEDDGMFYRDRVETDWPFRVQLPIGSHVPFHCTASGKTFLAGLKPSMRKAMVESLNLKRFTETTCHEAAGLLRELDKVAEQGYAIDDEEFVEGMVAIAVPVRDPDGRFIAALAFHGPAQRLSIDKAIANVDVLFDGAKRMQAVIYA